MTIALRYAAYSDVGCLREGNEDSGYAGQHLLAVADGMGGYAGGEVASSIAISSIRRLDAEDHRADDMVEALQQAVEQANASLSRRIMEEPRLENMGTTLTAMLWSGSQAALIHIGDSRAYLLRGSRFEQITHDHTLVQTLVDEGKITEEEVATHPQRSLILRALDGKSPVDPDISINEAKVGDRYLLCSDGLSGVVSKKTIHETLATEADPRAAAKKLIDLAIRGGGPDNITAVIADVIETDTDREGPTRSAQVVGAADQRRDVMEQGQASPARRAQELRSNGGDTAEMDPVADEPAYAGAPAPSGAPAGGAYAAPYEEQPYPGYEEPAAPRRPRGGRDQQELQTRRWWPMIVGFLVIVGIIGGAGYYFGRQYIDSQYFIAPSESGENVAIFRGIDTDIAGFSLSEQVQDSGLALESLSEAERQSIENNIPADDLQDAEQRIADLREAAEGGQGTGTEEGSG
jgi:PPM family protein phosphatase